MTTRAKEQKEVHRAKQEVPQKAMVAVRASKEIPKIALVWALTHVVQPGDCITLLVVVPSHTIGRKLWGFPRFAGDCTSGNRKSYPGSVSENKYDITDSCSQMILQLHDVYDPNKLNVKIKIVSGSNDGVVAIEAKKALASWVVIDKHLRNEEKLCMEQLNCNIVVMKKTRPKILRLNLVGSDDVANHVPPTTASSPEMGTPFTATEGGTSSLSSDPGASPSPSPCCVSDETKKVANESPEREDSETEFESDNLSSASASTRFEPWMGDHRGCKNDTGDVRGAISLSRNAPPGPPPLCSICQHKAPEFGKPPRWFTFADLELATGGFSQANFLAEGGFGSVHRGVLPDGQAIAVKQHKLASLQGDVEFCSEVEVLSCAQHRNVVMLIGFCIEENRRLLVYEYICNRSLDSHLYDNKAATLEWAARQKIAVGAARGLRYLHEECRVGCIVHRDMRPNNILITHDFEPMVGDFGLARWQPDGDTGVETRVIGTFGYLAPEYAQSGQITDKADVYSFGVVLVELITGRKAVDLNRPKGQQCLTEWARPFLEQRAIEELIDPRLGRKFCEQEVYCMLYAASLCVRRDPISRPRMSQVLRILEGDMPTDGAFGSTPAHDVGNRSARLWVDHPPTNDGLVASTDAFCEPFSGSLSRTLPC